MADHVPNPQFRSKLKVAKGIGSAKHGVGHWWLERITAIALIPLCIWFVYSLLTGLLSPDAARVAVWLSSPFTAIALTLMLLAMFVHIKLGNQVIIEDYIKCPYKKYGLIIINTFCCYGALAVGILSIIKMHVGIG